MPNILYNLYSNLFITSRERNFIFIPRSRTNRCVITDVHPLSRIRRIFSLARESERMERGKGEELVPRDIFVAREAILGESLPGSFEQKELSPMGRGEGETLTLFLSLSLFDEQIPGARPRNFKV